VANIASTSVQIISDVQPDGREWIRETLTDAAGVGHVYEYLAAPGFDTATAVANRAAALGAALAAAESAANVALVRSMGAGVALSFVFSLPVDSFIGLRDAYRTAAGYDAVEIGSYLASLTDAQLIATFGMTQAQVTSLRANSLAPDTSQDAALNTAAGA
jgi:hypothetical protein